MANFVSYVQHFIKSTVFTAHTVMEVMRDVQYQLTELISGLAVQDMAPDELGFEQTNCKLSSQYMHRSPTIKTDPTHSSNLHHL
ncbi:hypothetical protein A2U01_0004635 [Trifolium medium]|uniref:Uncharacterized protein n=1 Tax=Trifolium medium TaxID=97028 RepID=A0A392M9D1_9FABA|nr:hypothetical protein [Trifolium medium]